MKFLLLLLLSLNAQADTKISALPLGTAATTGVNDSFPYVNAVSGTTMRLKLSDIPNLPAFGSYNAPTATLATSATLAATATALASSPTQCGGGFVAKGIDVMGNAVCVAAGGGGSSGLSVSSISTSGTLTVGSPVNYQHIACDASGGAVVATAPACAGNVGQVFNLKKIDSSGNSCTLQRSGSDLIDGATSAGTNEQYNSITIVCRAAGFYDVL